MPYKACAVCYRLGCRQTVVAGRVSAALIAVWHTVVAVVVKRSAEVVVGIFTVVVAVLKPLLIGVVVDSENIAKAVVALVQGVYNIVRGYRNIARRNRNGAGRLMTCHGVLSVNCSAARTDRGQKTAAALDFRDI